jgi:hypothetical protein
MGSIRYVEGNGDGTTAALRNQGDRWIEIQPTRIRTERLGDENRCQRQIGNQNHPQGTTQTALPSICGFGPEIKGDRTPGSTWTSKISSIPE